MARQVAAVLFLALLAACVVYVVRGQDLPTPVSGLAYGFYDSSCPEAEAIVQQEMNNILSANITEAAGIIRLFFHDCFVQGCDASLLIDDNSTSGEATAPPNQTIRPSAKAIIEQIKSVIESVCPNTVSCSDIITLAARESISQSGGPFYPVPTGRQDGLTAGSSSAALSDLPGPSSNITRLTQAFDKKGLDLADLTALSGTHTVGFAHCGATSLFTNQSSIYDPAFAATLRETCTSPSVNDVINMDLVTPNTFDNQYFKNVLNLSADFVSDNALLTNDTTRSIVETFASDQTAFFTQLSVSMTKMSMIEVLTGSAGNIRNVCSVLNSDSSSTVISTGATDVGQRFGQ